MDGPGPTFALVFAYVLFVKKIGPAWMMDKKPFELRYPMFLYNAVLVLTNFYLILEVSTHAGQHKQRVWPKCTW